MIKLSKILLLLLVLLSLLTGCFDNSRRVSIKSPVSVVNKYPNWYLNTPNSGSKYLYSTGIGITKKEAILNALSNLNSKLSITISSEYQKSSISYSDGLYNNKLKYKINTKTNKLQITNYQVLKVKQINFDKFITLIKVNKIKLFNNLLNDLNSNFKLYKNQFNIILKENKINQFLNLNKLINQLKQERNNIIMLKVLNSKFLELKYQDFINKVINYDELLKNNLSISVKSSNIYFKNDISKYLIKHGIKISNNSLYNIIIKTKLYYSKNIINLKIYNIFLTLKYKEKIIGKNSFKIIIPKSSNPENYLYEEIKTKTLKTFFNIN